MKKSMIAISIFAIVLLLLQITSMAAGSIAPSPRSLSITTGGIGSFTITASNSCGRVDISSSNPSVATVTSASSQWLENNSTSVSVKGVAAGTASITVRLSDAATFDEEELTGSYTVTVTVKDPAPSAPAPSTPTPSTPAPSKPAPVVNNLSNNNKLSEISVEGYELTKKDENNYELILTNDIDKIKINAKAEDVKSTVEGIGEKTVEIGINAFEVIVTSESKKQNKYVINVTRKDAFYLEDLNYAVDTLQDNIINIKLRKDEIITKEHIQKVKESGKTINFNYFDENNTNVYTWIMDGTKINTINDVNINVNFASNYAKDIETLANYASGINLNLAQTELLPEGTKLKIYVGNRYAEGDLLYIYIYNKVNLELENLSSVTVANGYIELEIKENEEYFISKAFVEKKVEENGINLINILIIIIIIETIIIITLLILDYNNANPISKIKNKNNSPKTKNIKDNK